MSASSSPFNATSTSTFGNNTGNLSSAAHESSSGPTPPWEINPNYVNALGLIGAFVGISLSIAPIRDVWTGKHSIFVTKSTTFVATGFPYVAAFYNCVLWVMYGATRWDVMMIPNISNSLGAMLNLSFALCYFTFAKGAVKATTVKEAFVFLPTVAIAIFSWVYTKNTDVVGYIAAVLSVLSYYAPLRGFGVLIRERSTTSIPFPPLLLTLLCSSVWFFFGLYILNIPMIIPNACGMVFGTIQLSLYAWAAKHERRRRKDTLTKVDVETGGDQVVDDDDEEDVISSIASPKDDPHSPRDAFLESNVTNGEVMLP